MINILLLCIFLITSGQTENIHGISLAGKLKYPANFKKFDYTFNKIKIAKELKLYTSIAFNSFNPFIVKGDSPPGMRGLYDSLLYVTLTRPSYDEPFSSYCYLAESMILDPDKLWIEFKLRKNATFHDGSPILASDVIFSYNMAIQQGKPFYKAYLGDIKEIIEITPHHVRFVFKNNKNKELPGIIGQMPIFSKKFYEKQKFDESDLTIPLGNGPYKIIEFDAGQWIRYERIDNWWGNNIPACFGFFNFKHIHYAVIKDKTVAFEAFTSGQVHLYMDNDVNNWHKNYNFKAIKEKKVVKSLITHNSTEPMIGFIFNIRKPLFQNRHTRKALMLAFDYGWVNRSLLYNEYTRLHSYFANSELACSTLPQGKEKEILLQFKDNLPNEIFTKEFSIPQPNSFRKNLLLAKDILQKQGWILKDGKLFHPKKNIWFTFELLLPNETYKNEALFLKKNLNILGIEVIVRIVDSTEYLRKTRHFQYDMIPASFHQSTSPGNEQKEFWGSEAAKKQGSRNLIGIQSSTIDNIINQLIQAQTREELIILTKALDRILLHNHYIIPFGFYAKIRFAYWDIFNIAPFPSPLYNLNIHAWQRK